MQAVRTEETEASPLAPIDHPVCPSCHVMPKISHNTKTYNRHYNLYRLLPGQPLANRSAFGRQLFVYNCLRVDSVLAQ